MCMATAKILDSNPLLERKFMSRDTFRLKF